VLVVLDVVVLDVVVDDVEPRPPAPPLPAAPAVPPLVSSPPHESSCERVTPVPTTATTLFKKVFRSNLMGVLLGKPGATGERIMVPMERDDQRQNQRKLR
jgi:hypothetical protein